MPATPSLLDEITEINLTDLLESAGLSWLSGTPLQHLLRPWARRFAITAQEFDARVGDQGLARGSTWLMHRMTSGMRTSGLEHIPPKGPVFVLANHPGMTDTVALFASLASRPDLRVIALDRPFLRALPHVARQLIFLPADASGRLSVIRDASRHLKEGGALLTFPAGGIEPDPAVAGAQAAINALRDWSDSYALMARLAPDVHFMPALVSHVISPEARRHPLTLLRRHAHDQARLAATLQVALARYRDQVARVSFGAPVAACRSDTMPLHSTVSTQMRQLITAALPADSMPGCLTPPAPA